MQTQPFSVEGNGVLVKPLFQGPACSISLQLFCNAMCVISVIKEFRQIALLSVRTREQTGQGPDHMVVAPHCHRQNSLSVRRDRDRAARRSTLTYAWCPDAVSPFSGAKAYIEAPARCTAGESSGQEDCRCGRPCAAPRLRWQQVSRVWGGTFPLAQGPVPGTPLYPLGRARHLPPYLWAALATCCLRLSEAG